MVVSDRVQLALPSLFVINKFILLSEIYRNNKSPNLDLTAFLVLKYVYYHIAGYKNMPTQYENSHVHFTSWLTQDSDITR